MWSLQVYSGGDFTFRPFSVQDAALAVFAPNSSLFSGNSAPADEDTIPQEYQQHGNFEPGIILLNDQGCASVAGNPYRRNCTHSCLYNTTEMWSEPTSMYTLQNCLAYPLVSQLLAKGEDPNISPIADYFNILPPTEIDLNLALILPLQCPAQFCQYTGCSLPLNTTNGVQSEYSNICDLDSTEPGKRCPEYIDLVTSTFNLTQSAVYSYCDSDLTLGDDQTSVSSDLAGPGVVLSYAIEAALLLLLWICVGLSSTWIRAAVFWICTPIFASQRHRNLGEAWHLARNNQHRIKESRLSPASITALVSFQKAQCFFLIAVEAAAIAALDSQEENFLDMHTILQVIRNNAFLSFVGAFGLVCTTFGLFILHARGQRSWLTLLVSLFTASISAATWFIVKGGGVAASNIQADAPTLNACGFINPTKYCYTQRSYREGAFGHHLVLDRFYGQWAVDFSLVMLFLLLVDSIRVFPPYSKTRKFRGRSLFNLAQAASALPRSVWRRVDNLLHRDLLHRFAYPTPQHAPTKAPELEPGQAALSYRIVSRFLVLLFEVTFLVVLSSMLASLGSFYSTVPGSWTFGQIIAITIWVPLLVDFGYALATGVENAAAYKYPPGWKLVHVGKRAGEGNTSGGGEKVHVGREEDGESGEELPMVRDVSKHDSTR